MPEAPDSSAAKYAASRLEGLRRHAAEQKQATLERLRAAIASLQARKDPITVHTIRAESGLDYKVYARNPEALKLFQQHSTFLAAKRKGARKRRQRETSQIPAQQKDPLLNYKRPRLVARVREEMVRRVEAETQYRLLLEERVQSDLKIMQLEAELARFQSFLGHLRDQVRFEEQQGGKA